MRAEKLAELDELAALGAEISADMCCLKVTDLAINGHDVMALGYTGSEIKTVLNFALDAVFDEISENEHDALIGYIKENYDAKS